MSSRTRNDRLWEKERKEAKIAAALARGRKKGGHKKLHEQLKRFERSYRDAGSAYTWKREVENVDCSSECAALLELLDRVAPKREEWDTIIDKLCRLLAVLERRGSGLLTRWDADTARTMIVLCSREWVRPPENWKPRGKSPKTMSSSLARHLFVKWSIAPFLCRGISQKDPPSHEAARIPPPAEEFGPRLFFHVAAAKGLKEALRLELLPRTLTKRGWHLLLTSSVDYSVAHAFRRAQVMSAGGDEVLARSIIRTRSGDRIWGEAREGRIETIIDWLTRPAQAMIDPSQLDPIFDYIGSCFANDANYSLKGRTGNSIMAAMEIWHQQVNAEQQARSAGFRFLPGHVFPEPRFGELFERREKTGNDKKPFNVWTIEPITTYKELRAEGGAMHHCVSSYAPSIQSGRCSIWSLKKNEDSALTIEVDGRAIVQLRGACNCKPTAHQMKFVRRWASTSGTRLSNYL